MLVGAEAGHRASEDGTALETLHGLGDPREQSELKDYQSLVIVVSTNQDSEVLICKHCECLLSDLSKMLVNERIASICCGATLTATSTV